MDLVSEESGAQILEVSRGDFGIYTLVSFRLWLQGSEAQPEKKSYYSKPMFYETQM